MAVRRNPSVIYLKTKISTSLNSIRYEGEELDRILKSELKRKNYSTKHFNRDLPTFRDIYLEHVKENITNAPPDDTICSVTLTSTMRDFKDEQKMKILLSNGKKYEFLENFTMSGLGVYCPFRYLYIINPWTLIINDIMVTPYKILSNNAIQDYVKCKNIYTSNMEIYFSGEPESEENDDCDPNEDYIYDVQKRRKREDVVCFNIVIPLWSKDVVDVIKPLMNTNIFSMLTSYSILRNSHMMDINAHLAALGCVWLKTIREFPADRPQYITERLECISATVQPYIDLPHNREYLNIIMEDPKNGIEVIQPLIKPLFLMAMRKDEFNLQQRVNLMRYVMMEFIGRCINHTCLTQEELNNPEGVLCVRGKRRRNVYQEEIVSEKCMSISNILRYYTLTSDNEMYVKFQESLIKDFKQQYNGQLLRHFHTMELLKKTVHDYLNTKDIPSLVTTDKVNLRSISHLRNVGSCGDILWSDFFPLSFELEIEEQYRKELGNIDEIYRYVCHGIRLHRSEDRLSTDIMSKEESEKFLKNKIKHVLRQDNKICHNDSHCYCECRLFIWQDYGLESVKQTFRAKIEMYLENEWLEEYKSIHSDMTNVKSLSRFDIILFAKSKGYISEARDFSRVYKYIEQAGFVINACNTPTCPHFLIPNKNH